MRGAAGPRVTELREPHLRLGQNRVGQLCQRRQDHQFNGSFAESPAFAFRAQQQKETGPREFLD